MNTKLTKQIFSICIISILISMILVLSFLNVPPHTANASLIGDLLKKIGDTINKITEVIKEVLTYENFKNTFYTFKRESIIKDEYGRQYKLVLYESKLVNKTKAREFIRAYHNSTEELDITYITQETKKYTKGYTIIDSIEVNAKIDLPVLDDVSISVAAKAAFGLGATYERSIRNGEIYTAKLTKNSTKGLYSLNLYLHSRNYIIEFHSGKYKSELEYSQKIENGKTITDAQYKNAMTDYEFKKYIMIDQTSLNASDVKSSISIEKV